MKRIYSLLLVLALVLSSVSFSFASPTSWDTQDANNLQAIRNTLVPSSGSTLYSVVQSIYNSLGWQSKSIGQLVYDIGNALYANDGSTSRSLAWWVKEISLDTLAIKNSLNNSSVSQDLVKVLSMLGYTDANGNLYPWLADIFTNTSTTNTRLSTINNSLSSINTISSTNLPYLSLIYDVNSTNLPLVASRLSYNNISVAEYLSTLKFALTNQLYGRSATTGITSAERLQTAHNQFFGVQLNDNNLWTGRYSIPYVSSSGSSSSVNPYWQYGTPLGNVALLLQYLNQSVTNSHSSRWAADLTGYNTTQSFTDWLTLQSQFFTPSSATDGLYSWLSRLQTPLARLAYVHASDEEIAARSAAAPNQEAVVDNFIDSSGRASASVSDIQSISNMSSDFKQSFSTGASPSSIFQVFSSSNWGWFSQETANQLDTTTPPTRMLRSVSTSFDTPLLDEQIQGIYNFLGGD